MRVVQVLWQLRKSQAQNTPDPGLCLGVARIELSARIAPPPLDILGHVPGYRDNTVSRQVYQVYPTGFQKSVMAGACYALPDERKKMQKARAFNRKINMAVGEEDVQLVKWAMEGMRSSAFDGVLLSDLELGICAFQNQLRDLIPVVSLDQAPENGCLKQVNQQLLKQRKLTHVA